jgi:hypothetical protein
VTIRLCLRVDHFAILRLLELFVPLRIVSILVSCSSTFAASIAEEAEPPSLIDSYIHRLSAIVRGYWECEKIIWNKTGVAPKFTIFFESHKEILLHFVKRRPLIAFEHFEFLLEDLSMMKG